MANFYTDVAQNQRDGLNFPGGGAAGAGGLTTQPGGLNDPVLELGTQSEIIAVYTFTAAEVANDIIFISRIQPGAFVDPVRSNVAGNGVATTCQVQVGDTDTAGGTVAADQVRYSAAIVVAADMSATTAVSFAGGTVLITPASITDDGVWITAKLNILTVPVAGKKLIFRIRVGDNR